MVPRSTTTAQFVGSRSCAQCHQREYTEWQSSQHAVAMQEANDKSVLGDFSGATFSHGGVTSTFYKKDDKFWVTTDGADGKLADFEIRYTFGVSPLQQYLIELPKGRLQALGIAWDTRAKDAGGQRWFALDPERTRAPGDPLHWTGIDQNWNYQCAFCHATNLKKNYDPHSGSFHTAWSELSVGCEACHGPASRHVAWASKPADGNGPTIHIRDLPSAWMSERASAGRCRRAEPPFVQSPVKPTRKSKHALFAMPGDSSSRMKDKSFSTRSVPHCFSRTSITPMDSNAMRSTPTPRSCRAACTLRASPARTATIPTHRSSALQATLSAGNATRPRLSIPQHTITTREARRRRVHRLPYANDKLYGRRSTPRSFDAYSTAGSDAFAGHAQRLQPMPCRQDTELGERGY